MVVCISFKQKGQMTDFSLLFFYLFSVHTDTHTVNTMGFTIRREIKASAAVLSWVEETSSQASKAIEMSI